MLGTRNAFLSVIVAGLSLGTPLTAAQEKNPLQAILEGSWQPDFDIYFAMLAEADGDPQRAFAGEPPQFTEIGEDTQVQFTTEEDPSSLCQQVSAASIVDEPYNIEIVDRGDVIYVISEYMSQTRRIYMDGRTPPDEFFPNKLGWSAGYWEGDTLVVETTHFVEDWANQSPPLRFGSPDARMVERYLLSEDQSKLTLTVTYTDPKYLRETFAGRDRYFVRSDYSLFNVDCYPSEY